MQFTPEEAWGYAAQWGSYIRDGDPGACMYGFDETFTMQSEEHRTECLDYIRSRCTPLVERNPDRYDVDELDNLAALERAVLEAPCAAEEFA